VPHLTMDTSNSSHIMAQDNDIDISKIFKVALESMKAFWHEMGILFRMGGWPVGGSTDIRLRHICLECVIASKTTVNSCSASICGP
jgi:hypothetical protein